jgi:hypothetical protein
MGRRPRGVKRRRDEWRASIGNPLNVALGQGGLDRGDIWRLRNAILKVYSADL